jgi:hypothetical protein
MCLNIVQLIVDFEYQNKTMSVTKVRIRNKRVGGTYSTHEFNH